MPVILNFWASWCPPCKSEMPAFNDMYAEYGDQIHFMMVNATDGSRETKKSGAEYISSNGYLFPVYYDVNQDALSQYGIRAFPTSVFIDAEGYLVAGIEGAINEETLLKGINLLINTDPN
jgi:thiol-disulfide isomerase/thioredoxin